MVFKTDYRLMQVKPLQNAPKGGIRQYFLPSLSVTAPQGGGGAGGGVSDISTHT